MEEVEKVAVITLAKECDVSYRQADYWCRKGYIKTGRERDGVGSGYARFIEGSEIKIFKLLCRFVKCGLVPEAAAVAARRMVTDGLDWTILPGRVYLAVGQEDDD